MSLYQIKHQNMSPDRQRSCVEAHCVDAITTMITPECKSIYDRYSRTLVDNGEVFPLLDIIDFISTVETSNTNCAWTQARNLPLGVSTLDYKSLALDVKTDMAIHLATVTPNNKDKVYKKPNVVERGRSPGKYEKYSNEKRDNKSSSKDRNSSRRTDRSSSQKSYSKPGSRSSSKESNNKGGNGSQNRSRRSSKSPARGGGFPQELQCLRCGSENHKAIDCLRFKDFCLSRCEDCGLYHQTKYCNQRRTSYKSPSRTGQTGQKVKKYESKGKKIHHVELESEPIVFINQPNSEDSVQSLNNNLFRERKN